MSDPRKCTELTYGHRTHGEGLNSWAFAFRNEAPRVKRWIGCGLEFGVHLGGEWRHQDPDGSVHDLTSGEVIRASMGERYSHASRLATGRREGRNVGFVIFGERLRDLEARAGGELRFPGDAGRHDPALADLARALLDRVEDATIQREAEAYVLRHADVVSSPLVRAKQELERWMYSDLPIPMLAETGGMSAVSFTRAFRSEYGLTPATYRVMLRTNAAARLLWMNPEMPTKTIAEECGFPNVSYFFRTFRRAFGQTPTEARARFLAA
jgi:AraC-like DNA-binding protein